MKKIIIVLMISSSLVSGIQKFAIAKEGHKIYKLSLEDVTKLALENNFDIQMVKYDALVTETSLGTVKSIFDTILDAKVNYQDDQSKKTSSLYGTKAVSNDYDIGLSRKFSFGTTVEVDMNNNRNWTDASSSSSSLNHNSSLSVSFSQELGKNFFGIKDRGNIDIAKINIQNSAYTSVEKVESVISLVKKAYWDLVLQMENIKIQKDMVNQAKKLYDLHQEKLKDGLVEMPEAIASEANYKNRINNLILVENVYKRKENVLKLLLNIKEKDAKIVPKDNFNLNVPKKDFEESLKIAFKNRKDYMKSKNTIIAKDISLVLEKNNILPTINLTASLAKNGLGDHFKQSVTNITDEDNSNYSVGLIFSLPLENRDAKAKLKKTEYEKAKALVELKLMERKIIIDIIDQVRDCNIYEEVALNSIDIAELQSQKMKEEEKRFNVGRSNTDTLIRYQEDFLQAQQIAVSDKYRFYSALVDLELKKGTLLGNYKLR